VRVHEKKNRLQDEPATRADQRGERAKGQADHDQQRHSLGSEAHPLEPTAVTAERLSVSIRLYLRGVAGLRSATRATLQRTAATSQARTNRAAVAYPRRLRSIPFEKPPNAAI
jgi:hypothetical protein